MKKAIVIGATGGTGAAITQELIKRGSQRLPMGVHGTSWNSLLLSWVSRVIFSWLWVMHLTRMKSSLLPGMRM